MTPQALWIETKPYWLSAEGVKTVEEKYNAKFVGHWCTKRPSGGWNERPVDVFYVEKPDRSKGHTNYFGLFYQSSPTHSSDDTLYICDASTAFEDRILGGLAPNGEVVVSRYRHDYQEREGVTVDGGRDYMHSTAGTKFVVVQIKDGEFSFIDLDSAIVDDAKEAVS